MTMYDGQGGEIVLKTRPLTTVDDVKRIVAGYFRVTVQEIESASRRPRFSHPRHVAMALAYKRLRKFGYTCEAIGEAFGGRHYTTVLHACRKFGVSTSGAPRRALMRIAPRRMKPGVMRPCAPPVIKPVREPRVRTVEEMERAFWMREAGFMGAS